jgi:hypothetical protein
MSCHVAAVSFCRAQIRWRQWSALLVQQRSEPTPALALPIKECFQFRIFSRSAEPPSSALCGDAQFYSGGQCFAAIDTSERSLLGAAVECKKLGGELALPEAPITRDYLIWALASADARNGTLESALIYGIDLHQDAPDSLWMSINGVSTAQQSWNSTEETGGLRSLCRMSSGRVQTAIFYPTAP